MSLGKIGKYEKLDVLGHGVSGIVYLAWDTYLGKHVALKEISLQSADEERFLDEARVLDRLRHPNIVRVNGVDKIDGHLIIDMEYVKGTNLQEYMRRHGRLPVREALSVAVELTDALAFAHSNHIIHRDVKPANILISREGVAKIVDFGLAEILGSGSYAGGAGTYAYMSPEDYAEGERSDHRSDIWAAGVTLYEMLSGRRPFAPAKPKDPFSWKRAVDEDEPEALTAMDPSIPPKVEQVIARALAKSTHERYQSIGEMRDDLKAILETAGGPKPLRESVVESASVGSVDEVDVTQVAQPVIAASGKAITVFPERVDFGKVRKGESAQNRITIRIPGRGRTAGRIVSQPGWLTVTPKTFNRRKQTLRMEAGTESLWNSGDYNEDLILKIEDRDMRVPLLMTVLPPRRQFDEVFWWYAPLLALCLVPLLALVRGNNDTRTAAIVASGLLSVMLLIVAWVADLGVFEKLIPAIIGSIGLGAIVSTVAHIYTKSSTPDPKEIILLSVVCAPLSLICICQLLTAVAWRFWSVVLIVCSIGVTAVLMGWGGLA